MASEWITVPLGELGRIVTGKTPSSKIPNAFGGHVPFVTPGDMRNRKWVDETDRYLTQTGLDAVRTSIVPSEAVAVSCIGTIGEVAMIRRKSVTNQQVNTIIVQSERVCADFVYYCLSTLREELQAIASGSATPILNKGHFSQVTINLPPLTIQRRIADILGKLDDKIELNRRMNRTLEKMAAAIFKSWFIDFDPVHAKAEGRDPNLPAEIADLFPDSFEESELGAIPKGWTIGVLEELASIKGGKQLPAHRRSMSGEFPVFGANGIMGYCNECTHEGFVIAFGRVGAYCGSIHWALRGAWINNNASAVVPKNYPQYVLRNMLSTDFTSLRTGSAQPFIPNSALAHLRVILPQPQVLDAFEATVSHFAERASNNEQQNRQLAGLRDTLLPKLLSGEIELREVEALVEGGT